MWQYNNYTELYHHGILGQKWGVRKGPPYPIEDGKHSALEKKRAAEKKAKEKRRAEKAEVRRKKAEEKVAKKEQNRIFTPKQKKIIALGALAAAAVLHKYKKKANALDRDYERSFSKFTRINRLDDLSNDDLQEKLTRFELRKKIIDLGMGEGKRTVEVGKAAAGSVLSKAFGQEMVKDVLSKTASKVGVAVLSGAILYGIKAGVSKKFDAKEFSEAVFNGGPKKK